MTERAVRTIRIREKEVEEGKRTKEQTIQTSEYIAKQPHTKYAQHVVRKSTGLFRY